MKSWCNSYPVPIKFLKHWPYPFKHNSSLSHFISFHFSFFLFLARNDKERSRDERVAQSVVAVRPSPCGWRIKSHPPPLSSFPSPFPNKKQRKMTRREVQSKSISIFRRHTPGIKRSFHCSVIKSIHEKCCMAQCEIHYTSKIDRKNYLPFTHLWPTPNYFYFGNNKTE